MTEFAPYSIDRIILRRVSIPLHEPFRISNGEVSVKESVVIEIEGAGHIGFGEASPMSGSFYSADSPDSVWKALSEDLVPELLGSTIDSPVSYANQLNDYGREPFARAGIEGAVWHHASNMQSTSISRLFGAKREPIPSGLAVGLYDTIETLLDRIEGFLRAGYQRTKIKIQQGWDVEPLQAIRQKFGDIPLMVDANCAYDLNRDRNTLLALDTFDLVMIEQPLKREALTEMAELQSRLRTPLCADESAETIESVQEIIRLGSARIINIKVQRVGGLWNAVQMLETARKAGLGCWLGTMPELGIASAQALAIATLTGFTYPTDVEASARWFTDDIVSPQIKIASNGTIEPPLETGMGYEVDHEKLRQYTTQEASFSR
jgi:O-succinylbenzoate synthase